VSHRNDEKDETLLCYSLHKHGINVRHLGRLRYVIGATTLIAECAFFSLSLTIAIALCRPAKGVPAGGHVG
jgi:hypothetical protein